MSFSFVHVLSSIQVGRLRSVSLDDESAVAIEEAEYGGLGCHVSWGE